VSMFRNTFPTLLAPALGATLALATVAPAQLLPVGDEFQVNSTDFVASYGDRAKAVARDEEGNFLVVWYANNDGDGSGIFAQRFDAAGMPQGIEFQVNSYTTYSQSYPSVATTSDGGFVVAWHGYGLDGASYGIRGQRLDATGAALAAEFVVNDITTGYQYRPKVAATAGGGFVVAWESYDSGNYRIDARRFGMMGNPLGGDFQANTDTTGRRYGASVDTADDGSFVVVWTAAYADGSGYGIAGRRFAADGNATGGEFQVNAFTSGYQFYPAVSSRGDGGFVLAWAGPGSVDGSGVHGRVFDAAGLPVGGDIAVNAYTTGTQSSPAVAVEADGSFAVSWVSRDQAAPGSDFDVYARLFDAMGSALGGEFAVNTYTTGAQRFGNSIATDGVGNFVVAWSSPTQDQSVRARLVCADANGNAICDGQESANCRSTAREDCLAAATAQLQVNEKKAGKEKLKLAWTSIASATTGADFGDPVAGTTPYAACLYDDAGTLVHTIQIERAGADCDGKPCWKAKGTKGWGYKDKDGTAAGISGISIKGGDAGKGQVRLGGKNIAARGLTNLATGVVDALTLNIAPRMQFLTGGGACVDATINGVVKDDGSLYFAARVQ
jgi:hypothetical protein